MLKAGKVGYASRL